MATQLREDLAQLIEQFPPLTAAQVAHLQDVVQGVEK